MYIGKNFDTNSDGKLSKLELIKFFTLFFQFTLQETSNYTEKLINKKALRMTQRVLMKAGAEDFPGVSIGFLASLKRDNF